MEKSFGGKFEKFSNREKWHLLIKNNSFLLSFYFKFRISISRLNFHNIKEKFYFFSKVLTKEQVPKL
jgi:hypothetical protein